MSRDIRFRAWDGSEMHFDVTPWQHDFVLVTNFWTCTESSGPGILGSGGKTARFEIPGHSFTELMQWTGLKDKNGLDIYEGDIVKWGHLNVHSQENPPRIAVVELNPDIQFRATNIGHTFHFGNFIYRHTTERDVEVLGNIYQNAELLAPG